MDEIINTIGRLGDLIAAGILSSFGGVSAYLYQNYKQDKPFRITALLINFLLAFFLGNVVGSFIPHSFQYRDGILMIAGFSTWPILGLMELYGAKFAEKYLKTKLGGLDPKDIQN